VPGRKRSASLLGRRCDVTAGGAGLVRVAAIESSSDLPHRAQNL
jgi:hypothetical protein